MREVFVCMQCSSPTSHLILQFFIAYATGASLNHESLRKNGNTNVINWSSSAKCNAFDDIEYMCIRGINGGPAMEDHLDKLDKAVETIESTRKAGGRVLSHCFYGKNRRWVRRCSVFLHLHIFVKLNFTQLREIY